MNERLCCLSFDEIYISNQLCIDPKEQQVFGVHKTCQVVMVRGLCSAWKQPIFYNFDVPMTKEISFDIIQKLYDANFTVVSITSDMGSGNMGLWSKLNINFENFYFPHPAQPDNKIFVFADVPHLLKNLRNHFIDTGFDIDGKKINSACIKKIIDSSNHELKLAHKINAYHLNLKGTERQKVRTAAQLISNTVAKAIQWCGQQGLLEFAN